MPGIFHNQVPEEMLAHERVVVVVFVQANCGHCHEYVPRFLAVARRYQHCLTMLVLDADRPEFGAIANHFEIDGTPTTVALFKPTGNVGAGGNVSDAEIEQVLQAALRGASCRL
jgi:thioredoxin-like negative regulator of GroEL